MTADAGTFTFTLSDGTPVSLTISSADSAGETWDVAYKNLQSGYVYNFTLTLPSALAMPVGVQTAYVQSLGTDALTPEERLLALRACCQCLVFIGLSALAIGAVVIFLAANPEFIAAFASAAARINYWGAGVAMVGALSALAGGACNGFK